MLADRRTLLVALATVLGGCVMAPSVVAQMRPGQPPVLDPQPPPQPVAVPDFAAEFRTRYAAAGSPRIMLFWNTELSARARADVHLQDRVSGSATASTSALRQSTAGDAGTSTLRETNAQTQMQRQRDVTLGEKDEAQRATTLSPRNAAQFERAFDAAMREGGARLVDRAMALRSTSTDKDKAADNSKLLEAEALRGKADLLLQLLFVPDDRAPIGYAFDVSVRDVNTGAVVTSFYTQAAPPPPPVRTGYVATNRGFERQSAPMGSPGLEDVAIALANEVMNQLGPALPARTAASGPRK